MNHKQDLELELFSNDQLAGFRLHELQIFNWGTFHQKIWKLTLNGKTSLLTGDIGSGKSTIVDAITTLLVPTQRINYNKAAGAENKERDLRSYVLGYYKAERDAQTGTIKPAQLRNQDNYSVILGVFYNEGYNQYITLAQVFWIKEQQKQPARFFVSAEKALSIVEDFSDFGDDIQQLRKKLRQNHIEIFDTFTPYSAWFCRRFGIQNEQALNLFHQTISMKSVGNLTDFVRYHMLEANNRTKERIDELLKHFENLDKSYKLVLKAERQISLLTPLIDNCHSYQKTEQEIQEINHIHSHLDGYFAQLKYSLWQSELKQLHQQLKESEQTLIVQQKNLSQQEQQLDEIKIAIQQNGGNHLAKIHHQIKNQQHLKNERQRKLQNYQKFVQSIDECCVNNQSDFIAQQTRLEQKKQDIDEQASEQHNLEIEAYTNLRQITSNIDSIQQEIDSLKQRSSNIPHAQINIRYMLCHALDINESDLPFVGELLQIKENEQIWLGATERLLHSFALSMLVPHHLYVKVSQWVNCQHLKGRLVYYHIPSKLTHIIHDKHPDFISNKLIIKPNTPYFDWLKNELNKRFDFVACATHEQFIHENKAISLQGQIKDPSGRHEKDDRHHLDDQSRYVLGWSNEEKIALLHKTLEQENHNKSQQENIIIACKTKRQELDNQREILVRLEAFESFDELDVDSIIKTIATLQAEEKELTNHSNILAQLNQQQQQLQADIQQTKIVIEQLLKHKGGLENQQAHANLELVQISNLDQILIDEYTQSKLALLLAQTLANNILNLSNCGNIQNAMSKYLNNQLQSYNYTLNQQRDSIIRTMTAFNHEYPAETSEFEPSIAGQNDYHTLLNRLIADNLPSFRQQFKKYLNENTINEIANLNAHFNRERETIKARIGQINSSLKMVDYNPKRYISLELENNTDAEIREFQLDLRACTENTVTGSEDNQYSESKFLQVKAIIDRLRGREGLSEQDRRWVNKVCDVRNWFLFSATERWHADHSEYEYYPDAGGKSGGQKEKLAYTILAASLYYQFGLEVGRARSRTFRFVVIDEAFGRGSDESTQYGLRLFQEMNLQLLVVTPLQKLDIIEPFIASVGLVQNEDGAHSSLINLSIAKYKAIKQQGGHHVDD